MARTAKADPTDYNVRSTDPLPAAQDGWTDYYQAMAGREGWGISDYQIGMTPGHQQLARLSDSPFLSDAHLYCFVVEMSHADYHANNKGGAGTHKGPIFGPHHRALCYLYKVNHAHHAAIMVAHAEASP